MMGKNVSLSITGSNINVTFEMLGLDTLVRLLLRKFLTYFLPRGKVTSTVIERGIING